LARAADLSRPILGSTHYCVVDANRKKHRTFLAVLAVLALARRVNLALDPVALDRGLG
jgi:hypothetical protein